MLDNQEHVEGALEREKYLNSGTQTKITQRIQEMSSGIAGNDLDAKLHSIFQIIECLESEEFDVEVFRRRTSDQIIEDGYVTGCTDSALVFIALCRASGISTKYIESLTKEWLRKGGKTIYGIEKVKARSYY